MSKAMSYSTSIKKSAIKDNKPFKMTSSVSEIIKQKLMTDEDTQKAIEDVIAKSQLLFCQTMNIK